MTLLAWPGAAGTPDPGQGELPVSLWPARLPILPTDARYGSEPTIFPRASGAPALAAPDPVSSFSRMTCHAAAQEAAAIFGIWLSQCFLMHADAPLIFLVYTDRHLARVADGPPESPTAGIHQHCSAGPDPAFAAAVDVALPVAAARRGPVDATSARSCRSAAAFCALYESQAGGTTIISFVL